MELKRASALAQAGRFREAAQIYRSVLARLPEDAEATHFLGVCLVRDGQRAEGFPLVERSVDLAPGNAMYRQNYGLLLAEAGELARAEAEFRNIIALEPGVARAHNYLGMVCQRLGRMDEAIGAYHAALRLAPGDAAAANNLGYCLHERGDFAGAAEWLRRSLAADPRNPMAHGNLGNVLRSEGKPEAAAQSYRRAIELAPRFADAHHNLALALRDLGASRDAFLAAREAVHCAPENAAAWQLFADLLAGLRFSAWDGALAADCEQLFSKTEVEVQHCAESVLSLVRTGPRGRLFLLLLEHALVADAEFEAQMTALRRELLEAPRSLELACALAQQCFLNEYLWPETPAETAILDSVKTGTSMDVAVRAMYRPLGGIEKPAAGGEAFERLWRRLVDEPRTEAALEPSIPAITTVQDDVSRKVQAQYEEHPYPRRHRAPAVAPNPLPRMVRSLFPHFVEIDVSERPEVLIAGCGTGRHAAITAQLQPLGRVLAVDISRASLAYAARRCKELGLANVRFAQADILGLAGRAERYDLIECSGVLHHMADPLAGWRVLLSLLKPGGVMKLGLYSELGRRHIVAARSLVAGLEVREARRRILELPSGHPARNVATLRDFYSASGARDLILHVREHPLPSRSSRRRWRLSASNSSVSNFRTKRRCEPTAAAFPATRRRALSTTGQDSSRNILIHSARCTSSGSGDEGMESGLDAPSRRALRRGGPRSGGARARRRRAPDDRRRRAARRNAHGARRHGGRRRHRSAGISHHDARIQDQLLCGGRGRQSARRVDAVAQGPAHARVADARNRRNRPAAVAYHPDTDDSRVDDS
jgi:Flp pilus assembly protein TadD/SAM-dependent methyltransferase